MKEENRRKKKRIKRKNEMRTWEEKLQKRDPHAKPMLHYICLLDYLARNVRLISDVYTVNKRFQLLVHLH